MINSYQFEVIGDRLRHFGQEMDNPSKKEMLEIINESIIDLKHLWTEVSNIENEEEIE